MNLPYSGYSENHPAFPIAWNIGDIPRKLPSFLSSHTVAEGILKNEGGKP